MLNSHSLEAIQELWILNKAEICSTHVEYTEVYMNNTEFHHKFSIARFQMS